MTNINKYKQITFCATSEHRLLYRGGETPAEQTEPTGEQKVADAVEAIKNPSVEFKTQMAAQRGLQALRNAPPAFKDAMAKQVEQNKRPLNRAMNIVGGVIGEARAGLDQLKYEMAVKQALEKGGSVAVDWTQLQGKNVAAGDILFIRNGNSYVAHRNGNTFSLDDHPIRIGSEDAQTKGVGFLNLPTLGRYASDNGYEIHSVTPDDLKNLEGKK